MNEIFEEREREKMLKEDCRVIFFDLYVPVLRIRKAMRNA